jgi:hypothetical protein
MTLTGHLQHVLDRKLPAALVAGVLLIGTGVHAADHLEPEPPLLSQIPRFYDAEAVKSVFAEAFRGDVVARVLVLPPWKPAFAVGMKMDSGAYRIFTLAAADDVFPRSHKAPFEPFAAPGPGGAATVIAPQPPRRAMAALRCEANVDPKLGSRIVGVWKQMLIQTGYDDPPAPGAPDGEAFVFSMESFHPGEAALAMSGQYWGGRPSGRLGALVDVVFAMDDYCIAKDKTRLAKLNEQISNLEKKLQ